MENNLENKIRKEGGAVHLLRSEKEELRRRILATPLESAEPDTLLRRRWGVWLMKTSFAFGALVVTTIPLTYAAQRSVPGDLLHPLELGVVEPIERTALAVSPKAKVTYSTARLEERLQELQTAPPARLTPAHVAEAAANVQEQTQTILRHLPQTAESETEVEHLVKVSALLSAHESVLEAIHAELGTIEDVSDSIAAELDQEVSEYAETQEGTELAAAVQEEVADVERLVEEVAPTPTAVEDIGNHIEEVEEETKQGDLTGALQAAIDAKVRIVAEDYAHTEEE